MAQRDNILQELSELQSSLVNAMPQNIYQVPVGYFESLAEQILNRIRALKEDNAEEELTNLSPLLKSLFGKTSYSAPAGYFEALAEQVLNRIRALEANAAEELNHLSPLLKSISRNTSYSAPAGYFDSLSEQVLNRIKALEAGNVAEELSYLSPLLNGISKKSTFTVPDGYFDNLEQTMRLPIQSDINGETAAEELASLSPLLGGLKKEMPYSVPQGYFEELNKPANTKIVKPAAKVVSISKHKWVRYAAAAVITGVLVTAGFLFLNNEKIDPSEKSYAWVKKSVKKVSTDDIDKFVQLADEALPVIASVDVAADAKIEIKELIKDISDTEIQDFLEETQAEESDTDNGLLN